ncbi:hypothetical protein [Roseateles sp.]|uniref:hypothetical protein n=1 Tax=Roseateles sp. TaxID=1971397 RepID=UPI002869FD77|nr:hypothetical protein [Roseateles sp.]
MANELTPEVQAKIEALSKLGIVQLLAINQDFRHPEVVQQAAGDLAQKLSQASLQAAAGMFANNSAAFAGLVTDFVNLTTLARQHPGGDAVATLIPVLRQLGDVQTSLSGVSDEIAPSAGSSEAEPESPVAHVAAAAHLPARNTASTSTRLSEIAGEYLAMFDAAVIAPEHVAEATKRAQTIASFRSTYEPLGKTMNIPWFFIGLVHALESNSNFSTHLHNGDSLMHRTTHVPAGRPKAEVADPPFAWVTSARDALTMLGFNTQADWSRAAILYRLERYNGFGYRLRGLASPYLWSFSDRYVCGKFVKDGVFVEDAVSKQCGAAVALKRLIDLNLI